MIHHRYDETRTLEWVKEFTHIFQIGTSTHHYSRQMSLGWQFLGSRENGVLHPLLSHFFTKRIFECVVMFCVDSVRFALCNIGKKYFKTGKYLKVNMNSKLQTISHSSLKPLTGVIRNPYSLIPLIINWHTFVHTYKTHNWLPCCRTQWSD